MEEALPGVGAVDRGGLVQLRADRLHPGQQRDREERDAAPDVDGDDAAHREVGVTQPVDALVDQADLPQQPVQHAEGRVEHPLPGEGRQHRRDDERQQDEGADRSEEHTSELQSLMRISYAVFCLKKKKKSTIQYKHYNKTTTQITKVI